MNKNKYKVFKTPGSEKVSSTYYCTDGGKKKEEKY